MVPAIGIVVTFMFAVVHSGRTNCSGGCPIIRESKETTSLIAVTNNGKVHNSPDCITLNTTILYVCADRETYQFHHSFKPESLLRICTSSGWLDGNGNKSNTSPHCVKRETHCGSPPADRNQNIVVQIDGQNINVDKKNMISGYYSENTIVTYKCKDSKLNANDSRRLWMCKNNEYRILKNWRPNYEWEPINVNDKDPVCSDSSGEISTDGDNRVSLEPVNNSTVFNEQIAKNETDSDDDKAQQTSHSTKSIFLILIIGIGSSLSFVLIAITFGVLYKNRTRLGMLYEDIASQARQPPFTTMSEEKIELKQTFTSGKENAQYVNIIPIKVNPETIYTRVETGIIPGKKLGPTVKHNMDDNCTVYAEIHFSSISKDHVDKM